MGENPAIVCFVCSWGPLFLGMNLSALELDKKRGRRAELGKNREIYCACIGTGQLPCNRTDSW